MKFWIFLDLLSGRILNLKSGRIRQIIKTGYLVYGISKDYRSLVHKIACLSVSEADPAHLPAKLGGLQAGILVYRVSGEQKL